MNNKRILDFDFQLSRIFGEWIPDTSYDNRDSANGLYDIVFLHRETAQDWFENIKPFIHTKTKIVADITTESGNLQIFLDSYNLLSKTEPYQFYLIVDSDLSNYVKNVDTYFKVLHSFDLVFYAFLNEHSDNNLHNKKQIFANQNGFISLNNSCRIHRVLLFLEFLKRKIDIESCSFLFSTGGPNGSKFNQEVYYDTIHNLLEANLINDSDVKLLKSHKLPKNLDVDLSDYSYIDNQINDVFTKILNLSTENVMGLTIGDESPYGLITFTEKIIKPFLAKQIPLFIALPGLQNELRKIGFDLFDDLIDSTYETEKDHFKRIKLTIDELEKLLKIDLVQYKKINQNRFDYNFNLLDKLVESGREKLKSFLYNEILN